MLYENLEIGSFERRVDDIVVSVVHTPDPAPLYHYTKIGGALGILSSKRIRTTHWQDTGDPAELRIGDRAFDEVTANLLTYPMPACVRAAEAARRRFHKENIRLGWDVFIACFTELRASEKHFSRHGPIAIGFEPTSDGEFDLPPWRGRATGHILYGEDAVRNRLRARCALVISELQGFVGRRPGDEVRATKFAEVAILRMAAILNSFGKDGELSWEKEWRLAVIQDMQKGKGSIQRKSGKRSVDMEIRVGCAQPKLKEIVVVDSEFARLEPRVRDCLLSSGYPDVPIVSA